MEESNVENAVYGINVNARQNLYFSIDSTNFYNNYTGINIVGNNILGTADFSTSHIFRNKFHGDPYTFGTAPLPVNTIPAYGIKIVGSSTKLAAVNVGYFTDASPTNSNEFYNLYVAGIDATWSEVAIKGSKFYDFFKPPVTWPYSLGASAGSGIRQFEGITKTQSVNLYSYYARVSFNNLNYGIHSTGTSPLTYALDCSFTSCATYAIYEVGSPSCHLVADDNTFICNQTAFNNFYDVGKQFHGIGIFGGGRIYIERNSFNSNVSGSAIPNSSFQVIAQGNSSGHNPYQETYLYVNDNSFANSHNRSTCALITNYEGAIEVNRNYFNYSIPTTYIAATGLQMMDCRDGAVRDNVVSFTQFNDAFHIQRVTNTLFCNNRVRTSTYGFHALYSNNIDLARTTFGTHSIGLFLDEVGGIDPVIGLQYFKENTWCTNGALYSAKNEGSPGSIGASAFQVNSTVACSVPFPVLPIGTWFTSYLTGGPNECEKQVNPFTALGHGKESMSWSEQYDWYKTILSRGAANGYETDLMEYASETSIPALSEIEQQISSAMGSQNAEWAVIQDNLDQIKNLRASKEEYINNLNGNFPTESQLEDIAELSNAIQVGLDNILSSLQGRVTEGQTELENLKPQLAAVTVYNDQDQTYKSLLSLRIDAALATEGDTDHYETARNLSALDEQIYGSAVGKANYYLPQEELFLYLSGITDHCLEGHDEEISSPESTSLAKWDVKKLGERSYNITNEGNEVESFGVFDISGKLMIKGSLNPGLNTIQMQSLLPGHYIVKGSNPEHLHRIFIAK